MSYAELISRISALPVERRVQLFDFTDLFAANFGLSIDGLQACAAWDDFSQQHPYASDDTQVRLH